MSKMIITDQVIKDAVDSVVHSIDELKSVLDVLTEEESSLYAEFSALENISVYMRLLKKEMLSAHHKYDGLNQ